jgi:hypothetical protein
MDHEIEVVPIILSQPESRKQPSLPYDKSALLNKRQKVWRGGIDRA